jgi:hypothetical protein
MPDLFLVHAIPALDVFRIAFGAVLLFDLIGFWRMASMIVGPDGTIRRETFLALPNRSWTLFQYEFSRGPVLHAIYALGAASAVLLIVGAATKIALLICLLVLGSTINRNRAFSNSGHALAAILMFFCLFSPIGASLSVDSSAPFLAKLDVGWRWGMLACQLQLTLMYWASVYQKLQHKDWRDGTMIYQVTSYGLQRTSLPMPRSFGVLAVSKLATYSVLAAEIVLPLMLWSAPTAPFAIAALAALHLSMSLYLNVGTFPFYAIAATLLFLPPSVFA